MSTGEGALIVQLFLMKERDAATCDRTKHMVLLFRGPCTTTVYVSGFSASSFYEKILRSYAILRVLRALRISFVSGSEGKEALSCSWAVERALTVFSHRQGENGREVFQSAPHERRACTRCSQSTIKDASAARRKSEKGAPQLSSCQGAHQIRALERVWVSLSRLGES